MNKALKKVKELARQIYWESTIQTEVVVFVNVLT